MTSEQNQTKVNVMSQHSGLGSRERRRLRREAMRLARGGLLRIAGTKDSSVIAAEQADIELALDTKRAELWPTRRYEQPTVPSYRDRGYIPGHGFIEQPLASAVCAGKTPRHVLGLSAPGAACRKSSRGTKHDRRVRVTGSPDGRI